MGLEVINFGLVPDNPHNYSETLMSVIGQSFDLILTTGAVSMGKYDFIVPVLKALNAKIHFHKVAIRPGKPLVFAELPSKERGYSIPLFGMPGNPVSTAVALRFFVVPFLRDGMEIENEKKTWARLSVLPGATIKKPEGLRCFYKAVTKYEGGQALVEIFSQQSSYMVGNFAAINSWVILPEAGQSVAPGDVVETKSLGGELW